MHAYSGRFSHKAQRPCNPTFETKADTLDTLSSQGTQPQLPSGLIVPKVGDIHLHPVTGAVLQGPGSSLINLSPAHPRDPHLVIPKLVAHDSGHRLAQVPQAHQSHHLDRIGVEGLPLTDPCRPTHLPQSTSLRH